MKYSYSTMSKLSIFVSATIVLIFSAVTAAASPDPRAPEDSSPPTSSIPSLDSNLAITPAPPASEHPSAPSPPHYYPYQQAITFRAGIASDFPKIDANDSVLGAQYLFPKFLSPKLEAGADLHKNGRGHIHVGMRWIWFERSYFRPSLKASLDHFMDSSEGLATLAKREDWYLRGSGTLEYTVWNPYSLRLENELLINFDKTAYVATLGLSRGW